MRIHRLMADNFRSFRHLDLELGAFHVLVGPNASGKSNLLETIRFWRDAARYGVENAVAIQGGRGFVFHKSADKSEAFRMGISFASTLIVLSAPDTPNYIAAGIDYHFALRLGASGFRVLEDELVIHTIRQPEDMGAPGAEVLDPDSIGKITVRLSDWRRGTYRMSLEGTLPQPEQMLLGQRLQGTFKLHPGKLLIDETPGLAFVRIEQPGRGLCSWNTALADIGFYDFDPRLAKKSSAMTGLLALDCDASNLASVLSRILAKPESRKRFEALLRETLPHVSGVTVQRHLDRTLVYRVAETATQDKYFPAPLLSDGTVNITAMIAALFFEDVSVAVLEEPERNLHPSLVRAAVELLKDASEERQIVVSTHSPELVKYAGLESLILVQRREDESHVLHPDKSDVVAAFLEKDVGLDRIFVMDMLDAGLDEDD